MRTLLVMRHAKSDRTPVEGGDRARPLAPRGRKAAARMGRFLADAGMVPDLVLSSPAERARRTVELAARAGAWACSVREEAALYEAEPSEIVGVIAAAPDTAERILLAGHEPVGSELVERLAGGAVRMPTAAVACIAFDVGSWSEVAAGGGVLLWLVTPKLLGADERGRAG